MSVWITVAYLLAAVCFILGLRFLSSPKTARMASHSWMSPRGVAVAWVLTMWMSLGWSPACARTST